MPNAFKKEINMARLIADKFKEWEAECDARFNQLKANEEELNRIFIEIYAPPILLMQGKGSK